MYFWEREYRALHIGYRSLMRTAEVTRMRENIQAYMNAAKE